MVMAGIAGQREIGPVEQVKALHAELEVDPLRDSEILEERHVHVEEVWPDKRVPAQIALARPRSATRYAEYTVYER